MQRVLGLFGIVLVAFATGCPQMGTQQEFSADLTGAQEVPPVTTDGTGEGEFTLNAAQTQLSFMVTASGLSGPVTAAHFHQGAVGVAGDIVQDIFADLEETGGNVTVMGTWDVNAEELAALLDGNIYVNLHTEANPGGEIRGQVELVE